MKKGDTAKGLIELSLHCLSAEAHEALLAHETKQRAREKRRSEAELSVKKAEAMQQVLAVFVHAARGMPIKGKVGQKVFCAVRLGKEEHRTEAFPSPVLFGGRTAIYASKSIAFGPVRDHQIMFDSLVCSLLCG